MNININPYVVNRAYQPYISCPVRHLHLCGGAGSGKSYAAAQKLIFRCLYEEGHRFLIVRKIARTIRKSQFALLLDILGEWGLSAVIGVNKTEMEITFPNGNQIVSAGLDDPEKIKSIAGITGIWIEEATDLLEEDFIQLDLRLRGHTEHCKQIICSYNPIYDGHWIRKRFHIDPIDDCRVLHTTYKHNRFLDREYVGVLERLAEIDAEFHTIYTLGEWATPTDTIIKKWKTVPGMPGADRIIARAFGLDFGSASPSALVEVVWATSPVQAVDDSSSPFAKGGPSPDGVGGRGGSQGVHMYWHEHFYRPNMSNRDIIDALYEAGVKRSDLVAADSAERDRIEEIYREGFNIHPANKNVRYGIDYLRRFALRITEDSANLLKEVPTYKWRKDKNGILLDEPVKFNDHGIDAGRYGAITGAEYYGLYEPLKPPRATKSAQSQRPRRRKNDSLDFDGYFG